MQHCTIHLSTESSDFTIPERLGPTSVMEGALLVEAGDKVAMSRIEFADRQTNGIVLAVRPAHTKALNVIIVERCRHRLV